MPISTEHAARLQDPSCFARFRRENDAFGPGIHAIWGITEDNQAELQSIRFDAERFTVAEAKAWLEEHGHAPILFEPASAEASALPLTITAEAGSPGRIRVQGVAYSGGKMRLPGWQHPVVVDLAGLEIPVQVPLLLDHRNQASARVGMVAARVEGHALVIEGEILSSGGQAKGIVEQAKAGADWQLSIGAEVYEVELVRTRRTVNGREHAGLFHHVKKSMLREVSVVAVGADVQTHMRVAARFTLYGGNGMEFENWLMEHGVDPATLEEEQLARYRAAFEKGEDPPALEEEEAKAPAPKAEAKKAPAKEKVPGPVEAVVNARVEAENAIHLERERVAAIQEICAGEFPRIERDAIRLGWSVEDASQKVLKAMRENRPQADVRFSVSKDKSRAFDTKTLEVALCLRAGISDEALLKSYGEQVVESAYHDRDMSLHSLFLECARMEGIPVPRSFGNDTIRAAFSTVSLPGILNNVANKKLLKSFQTQAVIATKLCSEGELNDFKESERYRLTDVGDLEPVAPDGELKHGGLTEDKATNQLGTFGKVFSLTRQMIFNDDLGAFLKVPEGIGARAARKIDQLFFTRLLSNPGGLFSVGHGNYKEGVDTALSAESLGAAVQMFLNQTDSDGQPINVAPKFLLVPTALKMTAKELLNSTFYFATGLANRTRIPTYNALADEDLEVVSSPYLSNTNYPGASAKAWYLFADPTIVDTFEIGYLKGRRMPQVEKGEADFDTLGIRFRVFFDIGVHEQDHRGMVSFHGE